MSPVVLRLLMPMMITMTALWTPDVVRCQGRFDVSQDVSSDTTATGSGSNNNNNNDGREGDQWWRNYEVVEDHIDDLDDQLEMLYMYSSNALPPAASTYQTTVAPFRATVAAVQAAERLPINIHSIAASSRWPGSSTVTTSATTTGASGVDDNTLLRRWTSGGYRAISSPSTSQTRSPTTTTMATWVTSAKPATTRTKKPEWASPSSHPPTTTTVTMATTTTTGFVPVPPKKKVQPQPPQQLAKLTDNKLAIQFDPRPAESDPVQSTFPMPHVTSSPSSSYSSHAPLRQIFHSSATVATAPAPTAKTTTVVHPFIESKPPQHPRYAKLLNRYSLLDTFSQNNDGDDQVNDLVVSDNPMTVRQVRNNVQAPSARLFQQASSAPVTVTAAATDTVGDIDASSSANKRSRRRRPKPSSSSAPPPQSSSSSSSSSIVPSSSTPIHPSSSSSSSSASTPPEPITDYSRITTGFAGRRTAAPPTPSTSSPATVDGARTVASSHTWDDGRIPMATTRQAKPRGTPFAFSKPTPTTTTTAIVRPSTDVTASSPHIGHVTPSSTTESSSEVGQPTRKSFKPRNFRPRASTVSSETSEEEISTTTASSSRPTSVTLNSRRPNQPSSRGPIPPLSSSTIGLAPTSGRPISSRTTNMTAATTTAKSAANVTANATEPATRSRGLSTSGFKFGPQRSPLSSSRTTTTTTTTTTPMTSPALLDNSTVKESKSRSEKFKSRLDFTSRPLKSTKTAPTTASTTSVELGVTSSPEVTQKTPSFTKKFSPRGSLHGNSTTSATVGPRGTRFRFGTSTEVTAPMTTVTATATPFRVTSWRPSSSMTRFSVPAASQSSIPSAETNHTTVDDLSRIHGIPPDVPKTKRRRRPSSASVDAKSTTADVASTFHTTTTTATIDALTWNSTEPASSFAATSPSPAKRRKFRRRKITQRSTLSANEEFHRFNVTSSAVTLPMTTSSNGSTIGTTWTMTTTTTTTAQPPTTTTTMATTKTTTVADIVTKSTMEKLKKGSFPWKPKSNDTADEGKGQVASRMKPDTDQLDKLQAEESGDSTQWFATSSGSQSADGGGDGGLFASASAIKREASLPHAEGEDDGMSWFGSNQDDEGKLGVAESSPEDVKVDIDTRPLLISRMADEDVPVVVDSEGDDVATSEPDETTSAPSSSSTSEKDSMRQPKVIQRSRTATFSVSSSVSSSEDRPSEPKAKAEDDNDSSKFIVIGKTDLRDGMDDVVKKTPSSSSSTSSEATTKKSEEATKSTTTRDRTTSGTGTSSIAKANSSSPESPSTTTTTTTEMSPSSGSSKQPSSDTAVSYFGEDDLEVGRSEEAVLEGEEGVVSGSAAESSYDPDSGAEVQDAGALDDFVVHGGGSAHDDDGFGESSVHMEERSSSSPSNGNDGHGNGDGDAGGLWEGFTSPLSELSEPIRSSSSINVEVLSKAPRQLGQQQEPRRRTKTRTRSRQSARNIRKVADSRASDPSDGGVDDDFESATTKRHVSMEGHRRQQQQQQHRLVYPPIPQIKTAAEDIAQLFDATATNAPPSSRNLVAAVQPFKPPSKAAILMMNNETVPKMDVKPEMSTDSESVVDSDRHGRQRSVPANCSKPERNMCPKSEGYPRALVVSLVRDHGEHLNRLWSELQADRANMKNLPAEQERSKEELSVCDSSIEALQPGWARDAVSGKWMVIVNTALYPQVIRIESCLRPNRECLFISPYYKSTCVEHYSVHRLIAVDPENPADGPTVGVFKFPCGCSCKVEMAFLGQGHHEEDN